MKAIWNGTTIAESDQTIEVEGNQYFPKSSLKMDYFEEISQRTTCPWKGEAHYYDVKVDGEVNKGSAWYYPDPKPKAAQIKDHVAFWKGVEVKP